MVTFRSPHILMDFDANYAFEGGGTIESVTAVLEKMESLDYTQFINEYLMRNPPDNQLDNVQAVAFTAQATPV